MNNGIGCERHTIRGDRAVKAKRKKQGIFGAGKEWGEAFYQKAAERYT